MARSFGCIWRQAGMVLCLAVMVGSAGCSSYVAPRYTPEAYPASYQAYDLTLFWKSTRQPGSLTIAGLVRNTRYAYLQDLELSATLLDGNRRELGEQRYLFPQFRISMDETLPFELTIPLKQGAEPTRVRFFYKYRVAEHDYDTTPYLYDFETDLR